ncbi:MAG: iron-containing alcohol dehydrogenase [Lachnospiraceae bacterium]|nr:iron-containing alcohol dehydrogenase [Lachnospiraceae bacterium]
MQSFIQYSPTKVIFGRDTQYQTAAAIKEFGGSKVFVVYGGGSVVRSGLLDLILTNLEENGLEYRVKGGVKPNPRLSFAREAVEESIAFGTDFVLGVGGGSVLDTAKAIAHGTANPGTDIWKFWSKELSIEKSLPIGAVLTIPAAGSETSDSAVLTNTDTGRKCGTSTDLNRPKFAIMNPELTFTLPKYQIGCGICDIMMHTLDRYFTPTKGNQLTDEIAEGLLRTVIANGRIAVKEPDNYDAMSEIMWAGSLSHNGLTGLGAEKDFAVHQLGHELSAMFDVAHGATLTTVWDAWAHYVYREDPARFAQYARNVWSITIEDDEQAALEGIKVTVDYFRSLDMPVKFSDLDVGVQTEAVLEKLADSCSYNRTRQIGSFKKCSRDDILEIYKMANC